jgi:DNA-binding transcriptional MocR family regulator
VFVAVHYQLRGTTASSISADIESHLRSGALRPGDTLPPVRTLAADLGVSPATVASAYQALRRRGVIETAGRNGTRVRPRPSVAAVRTAWHPPVPPGVLDLVTGQPDPDLLPDLRRTLAGLPADGPDLRELARAGFDRDGLDMTGAAIGVTGGALDGIERVLGAHLRPGDRIAVEDPGWAGLLDLVAALGLVPHPVPVDDDGPTETGVRAAVAAGARAVVITSRAQNPTGGAVSASRADRLRTLLAEHPDLLVIEDDHAAELSAQPLHPVVGTTRSWAFIRSVSKPYGPDLRLATLAGDPETVARVEGRQRLGTGWVSTLLQRTVVALWTAPETAALVATARDSYDRRCTALIGALAERGLTATGRTGINVWVPVPDETAAVARLRDDGYAVAPGALFRQATPPGLRITVSRLPLEGVPMLADAVVRATTAVPATGPVPR